MLELKRLRTHPEQVINALTNRGESSEIVAQILHIDEERRQRIQEVEQLKNERNRVSETVAQRKKRNEDAQEDIARMRGVADRIQQMDEEVRRLDAEMERRLLLLPNVPHESVPIGQSEQDNVEVRRSLEPPAMAFDPLPHWEIAQKLRMIDAEAGARVTGARFVFYRGWGAKLERALANWMIDVHVERHGYEPISPPLLVQRNSLLGTGQLPKFEHDAFRIAEHDYFLIPTAEVPVTNFFREQILSSEQVPQQFVAYSPCFRQEAGAAGRDTRGLIRLHQFHKVELVWFARPEDSYEALERMTEHATNILKLLELPYRVVALCTGDLGFGSAKTYDLEVWFPSAGQYREISSCSNMESFQASRAHIRFRRTPKDKPEYVHTLNGSGLAIDRTMAALLENYQTSDGALRIPSVLQPYLGGVTQIPVLA